MQAVRSNITIKSGKETYSSAISTAYNYTNWLLSPFKTHIGGDIVEIGLGHGTYYKTLASFGNYLGIDIDANSIRSATLRFPEGRFAQADILQPTFLQSLLPSKADSIICFNVLEHIQDDRLALSNLVYSLKQGGRLMIILPAMEYLYNDLDCLAGHYRRYSINSFKRIMLYLPIETEKLHYLNPIGGFVWWLNRLRRYDSLDSKLVNAQIKAFDKYALPISKLLNPLTRLFFGQSLVFMGRHI